MNIETGFYPQPVQGHTLGKMLFKDLQPLDLHKLDLTSKIDTIDTLFILDKRRIPVTKSNF
jgi:hypothetical protein